MIKVYWKAHRLPRLMMVMLCIFSLLGMFVVEHFKTNVPQLYYKQKLQAANLNKRAMAALKEERLARGIPINKEVDPQSSGLIGENLTIATSDHGKLATKQSTINPNFSALIVEWAKHAHVKSGDVVAVGMTGSMPALNTAVLSALRTLKVNPIIIVSAASSQWGANNPKFGWLDMQSTLNKKGIIKFRPVAASLGGLSDQAKAMSQEGKDILREQISRYQLPFIESKDINDSINQRMEIFQGHANGKPIKLYINIGGGAASAGSYYLSPHNLQPGLNTTLPVQAVRYDSVMRRFMQKGVPVINMSSVLVLTKRNGFPIQPTEPVAIGTGNIFFHKEYSVWLDSGVLIILLGLLVWFAIPGRKFVIENDVTSMEFPGI